MSDQLTNVTFNGDMNDFVKRINVSLDELYQIAIQKDDSVDSGSQPIADSFKPHPYKGKTSIGIRAKALTLGSVSNTSTLSNSSIFENELD